MMVCAGKPVTLLRLMRVYQALAHRPAFGIAERKDTKRKRFFGIEAEARRLGVSAPHLWMVLTGRRQSARLMSQVRIAEAPGGEHAAVLPSMRRRAKRTQKGRG